MTYTTEVLNIYEISYPGFFKEYPDYSVTVVDKTASKARYRAFLEFKDGWEITFFEYLKITKIRKIGDTKPLPKEQYFAQERIDLINDLIIQIGSRGKQFLYSKKHDRYSHFYWASNRLWIVDYYTGYPVNMIPKHCQKTSEQKEFVNGGGTMWALLCDFTDYIFGDDDSNHNHGYGGLYCQNWGYTEVDMTAIRQYAKQVGYLK